MGLVLLLLSFPGGLAGKESSCNAGDLGSIPGLGWSHGEGNSYPLQYSHLENSMGSKKSDTTERFYFHIVISKLGVEIDLLSGVGCREPWICILPVCHTHI